MPLQLNTLHTHTMAHNIQDKDLYFSLCNTFEQTHSIMCSLLCVISIKLLYQLQSAFFYLLLHLAHACAPRELASNQRAKRNTRDCHALLHCANQSVSYSFRDTDPKAGWTMTPLYISKKQIAVQTFRYKSINCFETARFRGSKVIRQLTGAVLW